uniref:3-oxoacyl-[acyl-carrier-protein] reductase n=1 Tax=Pyramimonas obovata TaxID=1411642 RepID=A0A7S0WL07_9CHLO|mmetsp:Transcript_28607/g.62633  ORF Transcript_28607/g.62633 Transcript_28607/m.62633 type:complete len:312 (+) Transcript_28607:200-1135(+)
METLKHKQNLSGVEAAVASSKQVSERIAQRRVDVLGYHLRPITGDDRLSHAPCSSSVPSRRDGQETPREVALIVGAGEGIGSAIARKFAKAGYTACVSRRNGDKLEQLVKQIQADGGHAIGYALDARREDQVVKLLRTIEESVGPIAVCVFNVGANVRHLILDTTARVYFKVWEMACFAAFLTAREAAKHMTARGKGTILFTGATASMRGASGFAAFAGAKAAKRALAQAMARELAPQGIHVAHVVIDGPVDGEFVRSLIPERAAQDTAERPTLVRPDDVAAVFYMLHCQPRSAWTFELDVRPWTEAWVHM